MWHCGIPPGIDTTMKKRIAYIAFTLSITLGYLMSIIASGVFIWRHISVSMEETLFSLFHHIGAINMFYLAIAIVLLRNSLKSIFKKLSVIYDESK